MTPSRQTVSSTAGKPAAAPTSTSPKHSPTPSKPVSDPAAQVLDTSIAEGSQPAPKKRARPRSSSPSPSLRPSMAEPSAKRSRRTDSSAMWENDRRDSKGHERESRDYKGRGAERDRDGRHEDVRTHGRDDRRRRSRSRDMTDRRRERSRSRERGEPRSRAGGRDRDRDRDRDGREGRDRRDRERTASRERHRSRRHDLPPRPDRQRTRSRSPARNSTSGSTRARSPPRGPRGERPKDTAKPANGHKDVKPTPSQPSAKPPVDEKAGSDAQKMEVDTNGAKADEDPEDAMIRKMMGFGGFRTTKNTKVPGNDVYGVRKEKKTEYRQYMNRVGGFNRPLSPSRE